MDTTKAGFEAATDRLRTDWDADGTVSVHLPADVAGRLLAERGWRWQTNGSWKAPQGVSEQVIWHTDEALQLALVAENA